MGGLPLLLDSPMNRNPGPGLFSRSSWISPESKRAVKLYQEYYVNVIIRIKGLFRYDSALKLHQRKRRGVNKQTWLQMKPSTLFLLLIYLTALPVRASAQVTGGATPNLRQVITRCTIFLSRMPPPDIKLGDIVEATSAGVANGQPVGYTK
jgi:hypothetical protein